MDSGNDPVRSHSLNPQTLVLSAGRTQELHVDDEEINNMVMNNGPLSA
jgi:hypothetical protein